MVVGTWSDFARLPEILSVLIGPSLPMPLTFVGYISFLALYKEAWIEQEPSQSKAYQVS